MWFGEIVKLWGNEYVNIRLFDCHLKKSLKAKTFLKYILKYKPGEW